MLLSRLSQTFSSQLRRSSDLLPLVQTAPTTNAEVIAHMKINRTVALKHTTNACSRTITLQPVPVPEIMTTTPTVSGLLTTSQLLSQENKHYELKRNDKVQLFQSYFRVQFNAETNNSHTCHLLLGCHLAATNNCTVFLSRRHQTFLTDVHGKNNDFK